jgi:ribosomal protein S18 acetylase RimI-like enzyme
MEDMPHHASARSGPRPLRASCSVAEDRRMDISIRRAVPGDGADIARIQVATWRAAYRELLPSSILDALDAEAKTPGWERTLAREDAGLFLAVAQDEVVGFAGTCPARDPDVAPATGEVAAIYVHPSRWRAGAGQQLMDAALESLAARGFTHVVLWVFEGNAPARAFYSRLGFIDDWARKPETRSGVLEMRMRRALSASP